MSLGLFYNLFKDARSAIKSRSYSSEEILAARKKWQPQFYDEVYRCWAENLRQDAFIVNVKKLKQYPDADIASKGRGISPWFKIGLVEALSDEFAVMHMIEYLRPFEDSWVRVRKADEHPEAIRAFRIAYISYENVVDVDWNGDKYTNLPVIYCRFRGRNGTPYNRVSYCHEGGDERFPPSYFEFADAHSVFRNKAPQM